MPVKLNKVLKDLNVGLQTVVDFLHGKGCEIDNNPNVRIQDDQYALLVKEFGKNLSEAERRRLLEKTAPKASVKEALPKGKEKEEKPKKTPEVIKTEVPDEIKPKFVTKGKIDLAGVGKPKKGYEADKKRGEKGKKRVFCYSCRRSRRGEQDRKSTATGIDTSSGVESHTTARTACRSARGADVGTSCRRRICGKQKGRAGRND